jgi:putative SOS response-associated peptidase YedK
MCNRYVSPAAADIERLWRLKSNGMQWAQRDVFRRGLGTFVRASVSGHESPELVIGQWGLIPWFAKTPKLAYSTNNCRSETASTAASFKQSWQCGQRCLIPAVLFFEPNWESGKNEWWTFRRADGLPWALAGLWNIWTDKDTGEVIESYTMLNMNADEHPLMRRMHKPDPKIAPDLQDKRSVVVIEPDQSEAWLSGTVAQAQGLIRLTPIEVFIASPVVVLFGYLRPTLAIIRTKTICR